MGKCKGKQALFPSSYVEPIEEVYDSEKSLPPKSGGNSKSVYRPFVAARQDSDAPPASGVNSQSDSGQDPAKKNKFGKYKSTVNAMVYPILLNLTLSTVGAICCWRGRFWCRRVPCSFFLFSQLTHGLGAAIGGGLVRAIF
jgi:hypothetical protein